jgi:putrescine transport system substrate-binding protein
MHRIPHPRRSTAVMAPCVLALVIASCSRHQGATSGTASTEAVASAAAAAAPNSPAAGEDKVLNIYNWSDYIDPALIPAFEKEYGIKVNYDVYDSNDVLETKLLAARTGYDIVVPTAPFMQRQIGAGVYQKLDKALLPNLGNVDPTLNRSVEINDPGNLYGVIYFWGTSGVGYDEDKIAAAMPGAPLDSFAMLYDPGVISHFKDCGVAILDQPDEAVETVLLYLGRDPNSESLEDLKAAERVLLSIRPYVRYINSANYVDGLANGQICLALTWNGDIGQARARAREAGRNTKFGYSLPKEGAMMYFDLLGIPADAPHPRNAHLFINYLLRADVAARNSSAVHYAVSNTAAYRLVDPAVYRDGSIYLSDEQRRRLHPMGSHTLAFMRELNRTWTRFKTGQ